MTRMATITTTIVTGGYKDIRAVGGMCGRKRAGRYRARHVDWNGMRRDMERKGRVVIYKYLLDRVRGLNKVSMPMNANVIAVGAQGGRVVLWAIVDPKKEKIDYMFRSIFTGDSVDFDYEYSVGTVQLDSGLVCHVFRV